MEQYMKYKKRIMSSSKRKAKERPKRLFFKPLESSRDIRAKHLTVQESAAEAGLASTFLKSLQSKLTLRGQQQKRDPIERKCDPAPCED